MDMNSNEAFGQGTQVPEPVPAISTCETMEPIQPKVSKGCTGDCTNGCSVRCSNGVNVADPGKDRQGAAPGDSSQPKYSTLKTG